MSGVADGIAPFLDAARRQYGLRLRAHGDLSGGTESWITRVDDGTRHFVLRVSPSWRTLAELTWAYELASYAAMHIREALAPVPTVEGSVAFAHAGRVISLFPYVEGSALDRESAVERDAAACLLARLHQVLPTWPEAHPRPPLGPAAPPRIPLVDPVGFGDPRLDEHLARIDRDALPSPAHADVYRGNIWCRDGRIVALFDWDDARYWPPRRELAWSVWEFAQAPSAATLDVGRASRFLDIYAAAGGPVSLGDRTFVVPLIRDGLRAEVRVAAAHAEVGLLEDADYVARSREAFHTLARVELPR